MNSFEDSFKFKDVISFEELKENICRTLMRFSSQTVLNFSKTNAYETVECKIEQNFKNRIIIVLIKVELSEFEAKFVLTALPETEHDNSDYTTDLMRFYYQELRLPTTDITYTAKKEFTIRVYKLIYNSYPVHGHYSINGCYENVKAISFHSLDSIDKNEPCTEHIIGFDIQLSATNFEQARNRANNVIQEFCDFLSVLLDVGFFEPSSKFINFVTTKHVGVEKCYSHERYRTAFVDPDFSLIVKDNLNGLCPRDELEKKNFINGYYSINFLDNDSTENNSFIIQKAGNPYTIEKIFSKHRIYKSKGKKQDQSLYSETIKRTIHYMNSEIKIPRQIRKYFKEIASYRDKKGNYQIYSFFRNACRLYNKSKICSSISASLELSLLVAAIEALAKTEKESFSSFVGKYDEKCTKTKIDDMYEIRSKLFHAGEFSFFEYNININPFQSKQYNDCTDIYIEYKNILRSVFIAWIENNLNLDEN